MKSIKTRAFEVETSFEKTPLVLIPVPWSATASYGGGTDKAPELIREASHQLDFFNHLLQNSYNDKIHFLQQDALIETMNKQSKTLVQDLRKTLSKKNRTQNLKLEEALNQSCISMLDWIYEKSYQVWFQNKIPALVGGDHSISEALLSLVGEKTKGDYGLLHLDAHADLRPAYEGFKYSHASVMYNVLNLSFPPKKLVQVGVRDFCKQEFETIQSDKRISCYFDDTIYNQLFKGENWASLCEKIVSELPQQIYISLDVDGLSWDYAPSTGTPVPGGLSFNQVLYLLAETKRQNKKLLAFDVVETSPGESSSESNKELSRWNANVSARLIYYLSGLALSSNNKL